MQMATARSWEGTLNEQKVSNDERWRVIAQANPSVQRKKNARPLPIATNESEIRSNVDQRTSNSLDEHKVAHLHLMQRA